MNYSIAIEGGIEDGIGRLKHGGIHIEPESIKAVVLKNLTAVIGGWPDELNRRFVWNFAELVTIAEASRRFYGEPKLEPSLIGDFLSHCVKFFNSWTHI